MDVEGIAKQEIQLKQTLAELEAKNPGADVDVAQENELKAKVAKLSQVCP
jgi:hypothetical protein